MHTAKVDIICRRVCLILTAWGEVCNQCACASASASASACVNVRVIEMYILFNTIAQDGGDVTPRVGCVGGDLFDVVVWPVLPFPCGRCCVVLYRGTLLFVGVSAAAATFPAFFSFRFNLGVVAWYCVAWCFL